MGDERRFKQVLINLIKNSIKFTMDSAHRDIKVKLEYQSSRKLLVVHVTDTGAGIAEDELPKLFSRFGKVQRTAELNHDGIGLGLTIVKSIVEMSSG